MGCIKGEHAGPACYTLAAFLPPMGQVASEDMYVGELDHTAAGL